MKLLDKDIYLTIRHVMHCVRTIVPDVLIEIQPPPQICKCSMLGQIEGTSFQGILKFHGPSGALCIIFSSVRSKL
jgi:hypothetical protein